MEMPLEVLHPLRQAAEEDLDAARRRNHWAVILGLRPLRDGNQWCFVWGENIQEGVAGFGSTPEDAVVAFDSAMGQCGGSSTVPKR